jgi:hypothetical protein
MSWLLLRRYFVLEHQIWDKFVRNNRLTRKRVTCSTTGSVHFTIAKPVVPLLPRITTYSIESRIEPTMKTDQTPSNSLYLVDVFFYAHCMLSDSSI